MGRGRLENIKVNISNISQQTRLNIGTFIALNTRRTRIYSMAFNQKVWNVIQIRFTHVTHIRCYIDAI